MKLEEKFSKMKLNPPDPGDSAERRFFEKFSQNPAARRAIVNIAFVVVAMTKKEAQQLQQETAIFQQENSPKQTARFQAFKGEFDNMFPDPAAYLAHYGNTAEDWIPHLYSATPENKIAALVERAVILRHTKVPLTFWPDVVTTTQGVFAENNDAQNHAWEQLQKGYVLLIDSLSLFHPVIRQTLQQHALQRKKQIAVLILSPLKAEVHTLDQLIEAELDIEVQSGFAQFAQFFNPLYEFGVNHDRAVWRWLFAGVPELVARIKASEVRALPPYPGNRMGGYGFGVEEAFNGRGGWQ